MSASKRGWAAWAIAIMTATGCSAVATTDDPVGETASALTEGGADARTSDAADGGGLPPVTVTVTVGGSTNMAFAPANVTLRAGDTVRWVWTGALRHNVVSGTAGTADSRFCSPADTGCASAPLASAGASYSHTFTQPGVYPYFCKPHVPMGMVGTVTVTAR